MSDHEGHIFLTRRTKRRLRSLAIGLVTAVVIGVAGVIVIRRERAPAHPVTPAETAWALHAQPLLVAVDRIIDRHDALSAAIGPPSIRPTTALLGSIRATLGRLRKLPPAPLRLRPFRSEPIDALEDALRAYGDYARSSRTGSGAHLPRADREWEVALGDLAHLDRLVAATVVPSSIKPTQSRVNFVAFETALAAERPQLRAARASESALRSAVRAGQGSSEVVRLAGRSAVAFSALSVQASGLPSSDSDISALRLEYLNALRHAVLGANEIEAALRNTDGAQLKRGLKALATGDSTLRGFQRDLRQYGAGLTAAAAAAR